MGIKYGGRGGPCCHGHAPERRGPHGCRDCHNEQKRKKQKEFGSAAYSRRYNPRSRWHWIALAHRQLSKRSRGQQRAKVGDLRTLWERQGGRCALTGLPINERTASLDHAVPVSAGGTHLIDNLQWVHLTANHAKNSHSVEEFRVWLLAAADALRQKIKLESLL